MITKINLPLALTHEIGIVPVFNDYGVNVDNSTFILSNIVILQKIKPKLGVIVDDKHNVRFLLPYGSFTMFWKQDLLNDKSVIIINNELRYNKSKCKP